MSTKVTLVIEFSTLSAGTLKALAADYMNEDAAEDDPVVLPEHVEAADIVSMWTMGELDLHAPVVTYSKIG